MIVKRVDEMIRAEVKKRGRGGEGCKTVRRENDEEQKMN